MNIKTKVTDIEMWSVVGNRPIILCPLKCLYPPRLYFFRFIARYSVLFKYSQLPSSQFPCDC